MERQKRNESGEEEEGRRLRRKITLPRGGERRRTAQGGGKVDFYLLKRGLKGGERIREQRATNWGMERMVCDK